MAISTKSNKSRLGVDFAVRVHQGYMSETVKDVDPSAVVVKGSHKLFARTNKTVDVGAVEIVIGSVVLHF